ncbi:MAG: AAA family ATPase [Propionibacteriales bacterium]|nr:AAA family ATPase [Propionibacteriales bacterium]
MAVRSDPAPRLQEPSDLRRLMRIDFSDQQMAVISAAPEPGVIVAGAGTGKTTVMAARVVWLVGSGQVRGDQVLGLTFTNKAAGELATRVRRALADAGLTQTADDDQGEPVVSTYHAYAGRLIAEHGLRIGVEPDTRVLADASRFQLAAQVVRTFRGSLTRVGTHVPTLVGAVLTLDEQMSEHIVSAEQITGFHDVLCRRLAEHPKPTKQLTAVADTAEYREELLQLVADYRRLKRDRGVMDFADQMEYGATIAEQSEDARRIERERYRVVLLDEYQDTSVAQRRMLAGLFSGDAPVSGRGHPVTAVGDPCQAIYGWRGASVANLDEFPDHFRRADGEPAHRFTLSVNRRCGARILDAANLHAEPLQAVHPGVRDLSAPADANPGLLRVALLETHADEMAWVADHIHRVNAEDRSLRWSDIGVLVRNNTDIAHLQSQLRRRGVPVEVVGLGGLLSRPEVADVVATLEVIHELTANSAMLRLLTGPRWRIGPRDLALLGSRAKALAHTETPESSDDLAGSLAEAVAGADVTEVVSLADALEDPGPLSYSDEAKHRFSLLAKEIRRLRRNVGEPLVDLVRRVIDTMGIDVELAATPSPVAVQARENLTAFIDAVASFAGVGADASLTGLLAYLTAEDDFGQGLAVAAPTETDSVKLMTVHKAKGLEWDVVFVPTLVEGGFPTHRTRSRWTSAAKELPWPLRGDAATLPDVPTWSPEGLQAFVRDVRETEALEERRLGYVGFTRPRRLLVGSAHWWGPTQKNRRGPSDYLRHLHRQVLASGGSPEAWEPEPPPDTVNPQLAERREVGWPAELDPEAVAVRTHAAELVREVGTAPDAGNADELKLDEQALVAEWDAEIERLLAEARAARATEHRVELPPALSATAVLRLSSDPDGLARDLVRPMPRRPSAAARFGTRFHAWVESYVGQQRLLDPSEIPGAADDGIASDEELSALVEAFKTGPYADRVPHQVEAPFSLVVADRVIRGRIDAVYADHAGGFEVVDWKTNQRQTADPLQLALYRLAWSELSGVPLEKVTASFYYVRSGEIVTPDDLAGRDEIARLLTLG